MGKDPLLQLDIDRQVFVAGHQPAVLELVALDGDLAGHAVANGGVAVAVSDLASEEKRRNSTETRPRNILRNKAPAETARVAYQLKTSLTFCANRLVAPDFGQLQLGVHVRRKAR